MRPQNAKPKMTSIVARQLNRNRPDRSPSESAVRSAKRLDDALAHAARCFSAMASDLKRVPPDAAFDICGAARSEGLAQLCIDRFDKLRFDHEDEAPSIEQLTSAALAKYPARY